VAGANALSARRGALASPARGPGRRGHRMHTQRNSSAAAASRKVGERSGVDGDSAQ
jgi:hypothetical protein